MKALIVMTMALALVVAAMVPATAQPDEAARPSSGCDAPLAAPGDYEAINDFDGAGQRYFVIVPEHYAEITPAPLTLILGSGGGDAYMNYTGRRDFFDDEPTLIAIAGTASLKQKSPATLLALIDQLTADYCIDLRRVHVSGSSSSAFVLSRLVCEGSDRVASVFDGMGDFALDCEPGRPVPLLAITGDPDRVSVTRSVATWVEHNGCDPEPLVEDLGSGITRRTFQDCDADVLFYDVEGLGHKALAHECVGPYAATVCAEYEELDEIDESQRFFAEHPLPE